jgi:hypothetical protein
MFSRIRKHINSATVLAFVALIFAMTGGAFAVSGGSGAKLTASGAWGSNSATAAKSKAKPKTKAGPRGPAGKNGTNGTSGAPGATGPAGPAGPAGAGTQGEKGIQGEKGVQGETGAPGTNGTTGYTATLPSGATETGAWDFSVGPHVSTILTPISFPIPLKTTLDASHVIYVGEEELFEKIQPSACPGNWLSGLEHLNSIEPKAAPGYLCVYEGVSMRGGNIELIEEGTPNYRANALVRLPEKIFVTGAGPTGAMLEFKQAEAGEESHGWGVWAVTAE